MLIFADTSATIWENGKANFSDYKKLKKRIEMLKKKTAGRKKLPESIVDGNEIMKKFKLKPSKTIGQLLILAREQQLKGKIKTKTQAFDYLKKHL